MIEYGSYHICAVIETEQLVRRALSRHLRLYYTPKSFLLKTKAPSF
jgi:hypothetical protein